MPITGYKKSWLVFRFVKVSSSNYFCSQGKLIGSEAATLFIPHRYAQGVRRFNQKPLRQKSHFFILNSHCETTVIY